MNTKAFMAGYLSKEAGLWNFIKNPVESVREGMDIEGEINRGVTSAGDDLWEKYKPYAYAAGGASIAMPLLMLAINRMGSKRMENKLDSLTDLQRQELELAKKRLQMSGFKAGYGRK